MANYAKAIIYFDNVPTLNLALQIGINTGAGSINETCRTVRDEVMEFEYSQYVYNAIQNYIDALNLDYGTGGAVYEYPITITRSNSLEVTIEATEYGITFTKETIPAWAIVTIVNEVLPDFEITGVVASTADTNPTVNAKFTASVNLGTATYQITDPVSKNAATEADLYFDFDRFPVYQQSLRIIDADSKVALFTLPRVDKWIISSVNVVGTAPASVTINATKSNVGDVSTTIAYSIDGVNYFPTNVFTGVAAGSYTAYIKDNLNGVWTYPFTVESPPPPINSIKGYYRYKVLSNSNKTITINVNGIPDASMNVVSIDTCNAYIVKYLDSNGQYRFYPFNEYAYKYDQPEEIGYIDKFITNILNDQSNRKSVGFRNNRTIELVADVPTEHLELIKDLYTSPRVYLYIGDIDNAQGWLEVKQEVSEPLILPRKKKVVSVNLILTLPETYQITML